MASSPTSVISLTLGLVVVCMMSMSSNAQLSSADYYTKSCPHLFPTVFSVVKSAVRNEPRMGASLLRLFFHDCFVQGCDASILLDGRSGEKFASPSVNSARGFEVIDNIKSAVEKVCPGVVSCADILAITAQDAVVLLGGPHWEMKLGRKDSRTSNQALANSSIPNAASSLNTLISSFQKQGLSTKDLVALYGAHTIGKARCTNFRQHIYQDKNVDAAFASNLKGNCPRTNGTGDNNLAPLDSQTWSYFDNAIYKDLVNRKGLLHSDQELYNGGGGSTAALVRTYSKDVNAFHRDFAAAMVNMGNIKPLTGSNGVDSLLLASSTYSSLCACYCDLNSENCAQLLPLLRVDFDIYLGCFANPKRLVRQ